MSDRRRFDYEHVSDALIVALHGNVGSLADAEVMTSFDCVLEQVKQLDCRKLVIDFSDVEYFGSSVLEGLRALWKRLRPLDVQMALCGLSEVGIEILQTVKFDTLWPICSTRPAALQRLNS